MIASHRKLCHLLTNQEIVEFLLLWEMIAEPDTLVVDAELDEYLTRRGILFQCRDKTVVTVTDSLGLSPHGLPSLILFAECLSADTETGHQIRLFETLRGMLVLCEH